MDGASLALGIAALYTTCRDCYQFFTSVRTAEVASSSYLRELEIQQSILKAWGAHWEIQQVEEHDQQRSTQPGRQQTKLHDYLVNNRFKAEGVFKTLCALADTLSDQSKLAKRYGIQLRTNKAIEHAPDPSTNVQLAILDSTVKDLNPVISEVQSRLSILNKFKWALKDRDNFRQLINDLKSLGDSLYRLCPESSFESMNIYLTMDCLAGQEIPAELKSLSRIAAEQAKTDTETSTHKGYKLLASVAKLKARVNESHEKDLVNTKLPDSIEEDTEVVYLGKSLALYRQQVVYVEKRDYRGPPLKPSMEQKKAQKRLLHKQHMRSLNPMQYVSEESDEEVEHGDPFELIRPADTQLRSLIRNFYHTFVGANLGESVYGLDMEGLIDHVEGEYKNHCSILYRLPGTIGIQTRERPAENLKLRAPVTLRSILGQKKEGGIKSSLGARFDLARKLVRAVCLLHSAGWLHKNIRAESVLYFPEHVSSLQNDRYEVNIEIDVSQPILMGYLFSRPDNISKSIPEHVKTRNREDYTEQKFVGPQTQTYIYPRQSDNSDTWEMRAGPSRKKSNLPPSKRQNRRFQSSGSSPWEYNTRANYAAPEAMEKVVSGFTLDYYQHPAKHANPKRLYRHAYDVYSLGILLLEIGLWEELTDCEDLYYNSDAESDVEVDHYERRRWICRTYMDRLRWSCGDVYADVVLNCLMIDSSDDEVAKASQRELCARIVANLEGCQA